MCSWGSISGGFSYLATAVLPTGYLPLLSGHGLADVMPYALVQKKGPSLTLYPLVTANPARVQRPGLHRHPGVWLLLPDASGSFQACLGPEILFGIASPYRMLALLLLVPFETGRVKLENLNKTSLNVRNVQHSRFGQMMENISSWYWTFQPVPSTWRLILAWDPRQEKQREMRKPEFASVRQYKIQ